jgi:hypothetical protein
MVRWFPYQVIILLNPHTKYLFYTQQGKTIKQGNNETKNP